MKRHKDTGGLVRELAGLPDLNRDALTERWKQLYRTAPPARIGNGFLASAIAYRLQEQAHGELSPATRRYLSKVAENIALRKLDHQVASQPIASPASSLKPGTRLLREWHRKTYEVLVLEKGVQCNGKHYRSLSEVACAITGTKWSGPLFFGLKQKRET